MKCIRKLSAKNNDDREKREIYDISVIFVCIYNIIVLYFQLIISNKCYTIYF